MKKRMTRTLAAVLTVLMALSLFVPAMAAKPMLGEETVEAAPAAETGGKLLSVGGTVTQERPAVDDGGAAASLLALEEMNFTGKKPSNTYFKVTGTYAENKGTVTYNGDTYGTCLKMESATVITFTATESGTLTLVTDTPNKKFDVDGVKDATTTTNASGVMTKDLNVGTHTIKKGDSMNLFYVSFGTDCVHEVASWTTTKAADCIHTGTKSGTCSKCSKTVTETISATGNHVWSSTEYMVISDPDCAAETNGSKVAKCTTEGCTATDTNHPVSVPFAHTYKTGNSGICQICGKDSVSGEVHTHTWAKPSGADDDGWVVTEAATCTATGTKTRTCSNDACGAVQTADIEMTAHNFVNGVCSVCRAVEGNPKGDMIKCGGDLETAYAEWAIQPGDHHYEAFVGAYDDSTQTVATWTQIDDKLIREYKGYMRVDALGLTKGLYQIKVVPYTAAGSANPGTPLLSAPLNVEAHMRIGFAFSGGTASGAYNEDGTLKANANVIYVTKPSDITSQLNSSDIWSGKGITTPTCIRVIGFMNFNGTVPVMQDWTCGLTIEGVGNDAWYTGGGVFVKKCKNVEVRNLGVMHVPSSGKNDLIAVEQDNTYVWVHNCDLYYGFAASGDQAKGDGSLDMKDAENCTISFNHFWDSGKCSLLGNNSTEDKITYHHNWFDHSDSRHPRTRSGNVHVFNNFYDGVSKYGIGCTSGKGGSGKTSIFVEGNYFRNTKYPILNSKQGSDSDGKGGTNTFSGDEPGMIKAYNNVMVGSKNFVPQTDDPDSFDAYVAATRNETVGSQWKAGSATYSNFDTTMNLGVTAAQVQDPADAVATVTKWAGRVEGGDIQYDFNDVVEDTNYAVIPELDNILKAYRTTLLYVDGTVDQTVTETLVHEHTPGMWITETTPGCDATTQALVPGVEKQYCLGCGDELASRTIPGQHSNDGSGECTVCGYATGNGGGAVVGGITLQANKFTMHETTGDKSNTASMRAEDMAAVADGYFTMSGSGVNKRTKEATTVGSKAEWIDLPKSGNGGISFTLDNDAVPATVTIEWGNTGGGQKSTMVIKDSNGTAVGTYEHTDSKKATSTGTTITLETPGTYTVASAANATYSVRLYTLSVAEASGANVPQSHEWGEWTTVIEATCGSSGTKVRTCSKCGEEDEQDIPATGNHTWGEWVADNAAKTETRTCSVCSKDETRALTVMVDELDKFNSEDDLAFRYTTSGAVTITGTIPTGHKVLATYWAGTGTSAVFKGARLAAKDEATVPVPGCDSVRIFWLDGKSVPQCSVKELEVDEETAPTPDPDPTPDPTPTGETKTLNISSLDAVAAGSFTSAGVTSGIFTIHSKNDGSGTYSGTTIEANAETQFDDLTTTKRLKMGGGLKYDSASNVGKSARITFSLTGAATVKVWWAPNSDSSTTDNRQIVVVKAGSTYPLTVAATTSATYATVGSDSSKIKGIVSTLNITEAGDYILSNIGGGSYIYQVQVITGSGGSTGGGSTGGGNTDPTPTPSSKTYALDHENFTLTSNLSADGKQDPMTKAELAAVAEGYFKLTPEDTTGVYKRNGNGTSKGANRTDIIGTKAEFIELPKSDSVGLSFEVKTVPAKVTVNWGTPKDDGTQKSTLVLEDASNAKKLEVVGEKKDITSTVTLTEAGTYFLHAPAASSYTARLFSVTVVEGASN